MKPVTKEIRKVETCEYCYSAPSEGYVRAYKAWVCYPCFHDHHGSYGSEA